MIVSESELEKKTIDALRPFIGKNPEQIESILKEHLNPLSKNYFRTLADRMLKSSPDVNLELLEKEVSIRAIRLQKNLMPKESMSLPAFKFDEIMESFLQILSGRYPCESFFSFTVQYPWQLSAPEAYLLYLSDHCGRQQHQFLTCRCRQSAEYFSESIHYLSSFL